MAVIVGSVLKNHGGNMLEAGFFFCACYRKFEVVTDSYETLAYAHDWGHDLY